MRERGEGNVMKRKRERREKGGIELSGMVRALTNPVSGTGQSPD